MPPGDDSYRMTLSLNVLNHLGLNLYSNLPAVLSEAVANSWDADATQVEITIDAQADRVTIADNGIGMTATELNERYLRVGYRRRENPNDPWAARTARGRSVMGRKGIGKLSLFSIAKTIEVQSAARRPPDDEQAPLQRAGLIMDVDDIEKQIGRATGDPEYMPTALRAEDIGVGEGTTITLTRPKKDLTRAAAHLRRRLARRFSMLGGGFKIVVNGLEITPEDRDLAKRCHYVWIFGDQEYRKQVEALLPDVERVVRRDGRTPGGQQVLGWVGSAGTSTDLKPVDADDESLNRIAVLVRGKLAQEDVLDLTRQGGVFTKFLTGELHADFLDIDTEDDIATSSRQGIIEDDSRFLDFKQFLEAEVRSVGTEWNNFRELDGLKDAVKVVPAIQDWIKRFGGDAEKAARSFIGKINGAAVDDAHRKQLLTSGVIAFERLHRRDRLEEITAADEANLPALISAFKGIDDVEAAMYYDIVKQRLEIIRKFEELTVDDALEKLLQEYLFDHLWLLDPGWDRATTPVMEKRVATIIGGGDAADRVDIKYRTTGSSHVIVELKRAGRKVSTFELVAQTEKYRARVSDFLKGTEGRDVDLQVICVVGKPLSDWKADGGRDRSRQSLAVYGIRVVMYDQLIRNAKQSYAQFLKANSDVGEVRDIITRIENDLAED